MAYSLAGMKRGVAKRKRSRSLKHVASNPAAKNILVKNAKTVAGIVATKIAHALARFQAGAKHLS